MPKWLHLKACLGLCHYLNVVYDWQLWQTLVFLIWCKLYHYNILRTFAWRPKVPNLATQPSFHVSCTLVCVLVMNQFTLLTQQRHHSIRRHPQSSHQVLSLLGSNGNNEILWIRPWSWSPNCLLNDATP